MGTSGTLRLHIVRCSECILGNSDRHVCMHPSCEGRGNPYSDRPYNLRVRGKAPKRCPLRHTDVIIRLKKEDAPQKSKKWTRAKLEQLLRLHETEGMHLWLLSQHFDITQERVRELLKTARSWRGRNWLRWTDKIAS